MPIGACADLCFQPQAELPAALVLKRASLLANVTTIPELPARGRALLTHTQLQAQPFGRLVLSAYNGKKKAWAFWSLKLPASGGKMQNRPKVRHLAFFTGLFLFALYLLVYRGTGYGTDSWFFAEEMGRTLREGFERVKAWHYLGFYAIGAPIVALSQIVSNFGTLQTLTFIITISAAVNGVLLLLLLYELGYSEAISTTLAIVYGLATQAWPYSGYFLREPLAATGLLLATLMTIRYARRGGWHNLLASFVTFAFACLVKRTVFFLALFYAPYCSYALIKRREPHLFWQWWGRLNPLSRPILAAGCSLAFAIALYLLVKMYIPFPQSIAEIVPNLPDLIGPFVSPGWGLLFFNPIFLLVLLGIPSFLGRTGMEGVFAFGSGLAYAFASSKHPIWWGTWNWGPRQLNPVLPLLLLPLGETIRAYAGKKFFRICFGFLVTVSAMLAFAQCLVPYPFYEQAFLAGISEREFIWNFRTSPPLNQWRFLRLEAFEVAWGGSEGFNFSLLAILTAFALLCGVLLLKSYRKPGHMPTLYFVLGPLFACLLIAFTLHTSYRDSDYGGESGFPEAALVLRKEKRPEDKLIVYMWGEPPWLYIPRMAMVNYCKGECPPYIVLIKDQFIDGKPDWENALYNLLEGAGRVWVIMQGLSELAPERPVEFALAEKLYFAETKWTGPSVRLTRFDAAKGALLKAGEAPTFEGIDNLTLQSFQVKGLPDKASFYVELNWRTEAAELPALNVSIQLLNQSGQLISQLDAPLALLVSPDKLKAGEFTTRYALEVLSKGRGELSKLIAVVYDPATMQRVAFKGLGDYLELWSKGQGE